MTHAENQFDETTEAFFNAGCDDAPDSQRPVTLDLEPQDLESEEIAQAPARVAYLDARQERLKRAAVEIVATLAGLSGLTFGMNFARESAARSQHAAAAAALAPLPVTLVSAVPVEASSVELAARSHLAEPSATTLPAAAAETRSAERKSHASTRPLSPVRQRFSRAPVPSRTQARFAGAKQERFGQAPLAGKRRDVLAGVDADAGADVVESAGAEGSR